MIARIWKGAVQSGDADDYTAYMRATGVADYAATPRKPRHLDASPRCR